SGTMGLTGAADTVLVLRRDGQGVTLYGRGRDVEEFEAAVRFDVTAGGWTVLGDAGTVNRSEIRAAILAALEEAGEPLGPKQIAAGSGHGESAVRVRLATM